MTSIEIDKLYDLFIEFQSGIGSCKYNEKDAFRAVLKKIDVREQYIRQIEQDTQVICQKLKENKGKVLEWGWMRKSCKK